MKLFIVFALVAAAAAQVSNYLPPLAGASYDVAGSAPTGAYLPPVESFDVGASAPAHSFSDADGYRYKTQKRRVVKTARRHRREVSAEYLPPVSATTTYEFAAAAPAVSTSYLAPAASVPFVSTSYTAPAATFESASFSDADGYRYKTQKRRVVKTARRHRREVSAEYLPPVAAATSYEFAAAAPAVSTSYVAPAASVPFASTSYTDPAATFETASFSDADGYRYKTQKRRVVKTARRHRREVSAEYLPPVAATTTYEVAASAPIVSTSYVAPAASVPFVSTSYNAPAATFETASFSDADGYRYKTQKRRVVKTARRHRREVSAEYLPPVAATTTYEVAASAPIVSTSYVAPAASVPFVSYTAPAATFETASFSDDDGYRYKTQKRRVVKTARRHRREVSTEYLPPVAATTTYEVAAAAPVVSTSYFAPAASFETYNVAASAPAHSFTDVDGYRYKTHRSRVLRRNRN